MTLAGFRFQKRDVPNIEFLVSGARETKRAYTDHKA